MKIAVGGMIASGKSTLVKRLGKSLKLPVMDEFDADDKVFNTLLDWLYTKEANVEMLLQVYFLHDHYLKQKEYGDSFVVDRDIIEHWLFAQNNLKEMPTIMNMYNGVFMAYMNDIKKPDLYVILDVDWDTFKDRIMKRGRKSEVDNFSENETYFKDLLRTYTSKLISQCRIYDIPYIIIDTSSIDEDKVFETVDSYVKQAYLNPKTKKRK